MPSYLITGVNRGLGWEFLTQASADPSRTVIGMVRQKDQTLDRISKELSDRKNIHIIEGELTDYKSLQAAAEEVSKITDGSLDYLIANAGYIPQSSALKTVSDLAEDPVAFEEDLLKCFKINVIGQAHLFNAFIPLILKGEAKKVIALSSGYASLDIVNGLGIRIAPPYSVSKTALNQLIAKYNVEYKSQGVLFLALCPGSVATTEGDPGFSEKELINGGELFAAFQKHAPEFTGPGKTDLPVRDILGLAHSATIEAGYGGAFISHRGDDKKWLP